VFVDLVREVLQVVAPSVLRDGESDAASESSAAAAAADSAGSAPYDIAAVNTLLQKALACSSDVPPALPVSLAHLGWAPAGFAPKDAPSRSLLYSMLAELVPRAKGGVCVCVCFGFF
jgi:hypothetical protein